MSAKPKNEDLGGLDEELKDDEKITLVSKDSKSIQVVKKYAFISQVIKTSLENDSDSKNLPIMGVMAETLESIVEYMNHHQGTEPAIIDKPLRNKKMSENVKDKWDAPFIDGITEKSKQALYDLILAANYMDIKALLHLGCAKVASLIKGQPLEKIKEILDPKNKAEKKDESKEAKKAEKA